jgi:hypothetical protein
VARARLEVYLERATRRDIGVFFCTGKNSEVKIARYNFEMILQTIKYTMIYSGSDPSSKVIVLRPAV